MADIDVGPQMRRGIAELNGEGEAVGGIVVMRFGENAQKTIDGVKAKLETLKAGLPEGVEIVTVYDRSGLIERAVENLWHKLLEEFIVVALVCVVFLFHIRSSLVAIVSLPVGILTAFIVMHFQGLNANIMSLGGIAIAIGAMVDAAIVLVENAHKRLESLGSSGSNGPSRGEQIEAIIQSAKEVGRPIFYSLLIVAVSFAPVFTLEAQEGRLFKPLAFTKNFAMFFAAILAVTLVPALMTLLIRRKMHTESRHPVSRALFWMYGPVIRVALIWRKTILVGTVLVLTLTIPSYFGLGSEFMPPLHEGSILYMPTSLPGMSVTEAKRVLHAQGKLIKQFPEVDHVFGKVGRARTATDPAPLSMVETTITLKPENEWRSGMTWEKLIQELDHTVQIPGMRNIWWMPIQTRTEMLATGIRSPIGIKIFGPDLETIEQIAIEIEQVVKDIPGTKSAFAERVTGGYYVDFEVDRWEALIDRDYEDDVTGLISEAGQAYRGADGLRQQEDGRWMRALRGAARGYRVPCSDDATG